MMPQRKAAPCRASWASCSADNAIFHPGRRWPGPLLPLPLPLQAWPSPAQPRSARAGGAAARGLPGAPRPGPGPHRCPQRQGLTPLPDSRKAEETGLDPPGPRTGDNPGVPAPSPHLPPSLPAACPAPTPPLQKHWTPASWLPSAPALTPSRDQTQGARLPRQPPLPLQSGTGPRCLGSQPPPTPPPGQGWGAPGSPPLQGQRKAGRRDTRESRDRSWALAAAVSLFKHQPPGGAPGKADAPQGAGLRGAGRGSTRRAATCAGAGPCGRSWAASGHSGTRGRARGAGGSRSGRGDRGSAARPGDPQ